MRPLLCIAAVLLGASVPLAPVAVAAEREPIERIVAVVNDSVILASELEGQAELVRQRMQRAGENPPAPDVLRERLLDQLIAEEIQIQHARRRGISVDDETINNALRNIAADRGTDLAGLRKQMPAQGLDFAQLRDEVRVQLLLSRLRQRVIASQVTVSEQEVDDFLAQIDRGRGRDTAYRVRHLLLRLPEGASESEAEQTRERAERIVAELRGGADFSSMAAAESDGPEALSGGDLGWREPADLPGLFVEALQSMQPGDVSDPLRSANGLHVLKLVEQRGGETRSVTEHRARHILLREDDGSDRPRRELAELRRRIRDGTSFEQLARQYSEDEDTAPRGGNLGWFGPGEMTPAFQEVIETLEPGQVSEPFRTRFGWHIVEVLERRERTDVERYRRAQARQALYRLQVEEETQRWLRERREESYIDRRLERD